MENRTYWKVEVYSKSGERLDRFWVVNYTKESFLEIHFQYADSSLFSIIPTKITRTEYHAATGFFSH